MIRSLNSEDYEELVRIHNKFYQDVFDFPDFHRNFLAAFLIEEDGKMISAAGIKLIPEIVTITNKEFSVKKRRKALLEIMAASSCITKKQGYNQLFAFVRDDKWAEIMRKKGFVDYLGKPLVFEV